MARRRTRNPSAFGTIILGAYAVAAVAAGYAVYRVIARRRQAKGIDPSRGLTPPTGDGPVPSPLGGAAPPPGECGAAYPGFTFDGQGCVPTDATPAGIYVGEGCSDFVFVEGEEGPQLDFLESLIKQHAEGTRHAEDESADPTALASEFFANFWGECGWPPAPSSPRRIVQLYQAIVYTIGHEIIAAGGRVLGTKDPDVVDEQIAERLAEMGFFDFEPDVVPEIIIPELEDEDIVAPVQPDFAPLEP